MCLKTFGHLVVFTMLHCRRCLLQSFTLKKKKGGGCHRAHAACMHACGTWGVDFCACSVGVSELLGGVTELELVSTPSYIS